MLLSLMKLNAFLYVVCMHKFVLMCNKLPVSERNRWSLRESVDRDQLKMQTTNNTRRYPLIVIKPF